MPDPPSMRDRGDYWQSNSRRDIIPPDLLKEKRNIDVKIQLWVSDAANYRPFAVMDHYELDRHVSAYLTYQKYIEGGMSDESAYKIGYILSKHYYDNQEKWQTDFFHYIHVSEEKLGVSEYNQYKLDKSLLSKMFSDTVSEEEATKTQLYVERNRAFTRDFDENVIGGYYLDPDDDEDGDSEDKDENAFQCYLRTGPNLEFKRFLRKSFVNAEFLSILDSITSEFMDLFEAVIRQEDDMQNLTDEIIQKGGESARVTFYEELIDAPKFKRLTYEEIHGKERRFEYFPKWSDLMSMSCADRALAVDMKHLYTPNSVEKTVLPDRKKLEFLALGALLNVSVDPDNPVIKLIDSLPDDDHKIPIVIEYIDPGDPVESRFLFTDIWIDPKVFKKKRMKISKRRDASALFDPGNMNEPISAEMSDLLHRNIT